MTSSARIWPALALLALVACAHRSAPAEALDAYAAAVERRDFGTAYGMMSSAFRDRVSLAEYRGQMERDAADVAAEATSLRQSMNRWGGRLEIPIAPDERVSLVREGGSWRLDDQPFEPYGQGTPRAALRAFVRAVETRRYDVLVRLAPARFRPALTVERLRAYWEGENASEHRNLLREIRLALGTRIAQEGDEAFMTYGNNRQVRFVREDGLWRIETPE